MPDALNYLEIPRLGVGKTAAQIRARFGPEDQIEVARDGTIHVLRYNMRVYGIENGVRHELVRPVVFFFGPGGLCHTAG